MWYLLDEILLQKFSQHLGLRTMALKMMFGHVCAIILISTSCCMAQEYEEVIVSSGSIRGVKKDGVTTYLGVPYAEPPVGSLRFKAPQPHKEWSGVRDALVKAPTCPQNVSMMEAIDPEFYNMLFKPLMDNMSEDCLILDIYVPEELPENSPVLFWIHGGGFAVGDTSFNGYTDGDILAKATSSIVIGIQYRLNIFGFLPINHPDYAANLGILDQTLALKWVQENVHVFNGDKNSVTIFGESAGGMSVFAHMQSPLSSGLFHKAIPQSGFPYVTLATVEEGEATVTKQVAASTGCPTEDQLQMINCLENLSTEALLDASSNILATNYLDQNVFERQPIDTYKEGLFNKVALMVTLTSDDGSVLVEAFQEHGRAVVQKGLSAEAQDGVITAAMMYTTRVPYKEVEFYKKLIKYEYDLDNSDPAKMLRNTYDFCRDIFFGGMPLFVAEAYSKAGLPVYVSVLDQPMRNNKGLIEVGAAHGDDLFYVFGMIHREKLNEVENRPEASEEQFSLTENIMKTIDDFSRGNDLIIKWKGEDIKWPKFTLDDKKYVWWNVDMSPESVRSNPYERAVKFWSDLMPSLMDIGSACSASTESSIDSNKDPDVMDIYKNKGVDKDEL